MSTNRKKRAKNAEERQQRADLQFEKDLRGHEDEWRNRPKYLSLYMESFRESFTGLTIKDVGFSFDAVHAFGRNQ